MVFCPGAGDDPFPVEGADADFDELDLSVDELEEESLEDLLEDVLDEERLRSRSNRDDRLELLELFDLEEEFRLNRDDRLLLELDELLLYWLLLLYELLYRLLF